MQDIIISSCLILRLTLKIFLPILDSTKLCDSNSIKSNFDLVINRRVC